MCYGLVWYAVYGLVLLAYGWVVMFTPSWASSFNYSLPTFCITPGPKIRFFYYFNPFNLKFKNNSSQTKISKNSPLVAPTSMVWLIRVTPHDVTQLIYTVAFEKIAADVAIGVTPNNLARLSYKSRHSVCRHWRTQLWACLGRCSGSDAVGCCYFSG